MTNPQMTQCKVCGLEIAKSAKACPQCGATNKKPVYQRPWFIAIIVFLALGVIGSLGSRNETSNGGASSSGPSSSSPSNDGTSNGGTVNSAQPEKKAEKLANLELVNGAEGVTATKDTYSLYFEGYIKNNTDREYNYVSITFNLYDKDDALLGTAIDNVNNLKGGKQWKFKAMAFLTSDQLSEVAKYEVADITGF